MRGDDVSNIEIVNEVTTDGSCDIADKTNATTKLTEPIIAMFDERNSDLQHIEQENPLKDCIPELFLQQKHYCTLVNHLMTQSLMLPRDLFNSSFHKSRACSRQYIRKQCTRFKKYTRRF